MKTALFAGQFIGGLVHVIYSYLAWLFFGAVLVTVDEVEGGLDYGV